MNKAAYSTIKGDAKNRMSGHFGEAFIALVLLPFAFSTGRSIITLIFANVEIIGSIIDFFIIVLILYITLNLALKLSRGKYSSLFVNVFGERKVYLNLLLYTLITTAILMFPLYLFTDYVVNLADHFASIPADNFLTDEELSTIFREYLPSTELLYTSLILVILSVIVRVKLYLTPYLIIDRNMKAIDAIKLSWNYTNGNFLRIFFFPLSFILWFLLIFLTCGLILIYLIPYMSVSQASLYNTILKENDDYNEVVQGNEFAKPIDPLYEEKKNAPLDDYYE